MLDRRERALGIEFLHQDDGAAEAWRSVGADGHLSDQSVAAGLLNRSAVALRVEEWTQSPQAKEGGALFMLDLDDFKSINDTLGHTLGDKALLLTAHTLREAFRDSDILGRAGGDEFLVFLSGTNSLELLSSRAEALCRENKPGLPLSGHAAACHFPLKEAAHA